MGLTPDFFTQRPEKEPDRDDRKKKKRSAIDELEDVKKLYDRFQQIKKYAGWLSNPGVLAGLIIFGVILFILISQGGGGGFTPAGADPAPTPSGGSGFPPVPGLTLRLTGPSTAGNDENLTYRVEVSHNESVGNIPIESITVYLDLPSNAFLALATGQPRQNGNQVTWPLSEFSNQNSFTFTLVPSQPDTVVEVKVYGRAAGVAGGGLGGLLPTTTFSAKVDTEQQAIAATIRSNPGLVAAYQQAEAATGVPWQILAGIHFKEGGLNGNNSLVSGRPIGTNEPDIVSGGGCSSTYVQGQPVALPGGGCGFRTFVDSAIYAANHFKGKNGGSVPATFEELTRSLSYYNGGGNSNCGKTPYTGCPALFTGEDDAYVMTFFDQKHETMYIVYCADFTLCDPPRPDVRPGVAAVAMALSRFY